MATSPEGDEVAEVVSLSGRGSGPNARKRKLALRRAQIMQLKTAGLSDKQIGDRLHMSERAVRQVVNRTLEQTVSLDVEKKRTLENAMLDRAQAAIWPQVLKGDVKAVDSYLRISQRRARLNGLDAPTQLNLSISVRQEMEQALRELENVIVGEVIDHVPPDSADLDVDPG